MRARIQTIYTAAELKAANPRGFAKALEDYRQHVYSDPAWASEHRQSRDAVLAFFKNPPSGRYGDEWEALEGPRAMAWIENRILGPLRAPWLPFAKRSRYTKPGAVPSCPFTGYCADDDNLEFVVKEARDGTPLGEIPRMLESFAERRWEDDIEDQCREDEFLESSEANGWEYDEQGSMQ
jgi:hypothetical protein